MKRGKASRKKKRPIVSPARRRARADLLKASVEATDRLAENVELAREDLAPPNDEAPGEEFMRV